MSLLVEYLERKLPYYTDWRSNGSWLAPTITGRSILMSQTVEISFNHEVTPLLTVCKVSSQGSQKTIESYTYGGADSDELVDRLDELVAQVKKETHTYLIAKLAKLGLGEWEEQTRACEVPAIIVHRKCIYLDLGFSGKTWSMYNACIDGEDLLASDVVGMDDPRFDDWVVESSRLLEKEIDE